MAASSNSIACAPIGDLSDGAPIWAPTDRLARAGLVGAIDKLEQTFRQSFSVIDLASGRLERVAADWIGADLTSRLALCDEIARRGVPEVLEECAPVQLLAAPLWADGEPTDLLAVACFLTDHVKEESQVTAAAETLGISSERLWQWSQTQSIWPPHATVELATALHNAELGRQANNRLDGQLSDLSSHLLSTFEELSMLHRLAERLCLSSDEAELCGLALKWLEDIVPARSLAIVLNPRQSSGYSDTASDSPLVLTAGESFVQETEFTQFIERLGPEAPSRCLVLNRDRTSSPTWCYANVREVISSPIRSGEKTLGWLLAINFKSGGQQTNGVSEGEFGTVEASLLSSVAAILGVHAGNISLYREQEELFQHLVQALSSAIDAKDPYTCGHSDRVARIAVCLAQQLGCTSEEINTIYLSGLLHDIGKIGIDDQVLRKPGKLTKEEYDHIKTHPELGYRILRGVKKLEIVLPIVLHHHEAWDGSGYPAGFVGEDCPRLARIVAVADSIDAMGSDRPYRKGIPIEKLSEILREGAGRQWDEEIVEAFLAIRDQIAGINSTNPEHLSLNVEAWPAKA